MIRWQWGRFEDFTAAQLYAVFAARESVFVVEQDCPYQELDGLDPGASHLVGWSGSEVAAYLRVLAPGVRYAEASIGRVLTSKPFRGSGAGRTLVEMSLEYIAKQYPGHGVRISAQAHLERFYRSYGFEPVSETYLEDDIPHVEMLRPPA